VICVLEEIPLNICLLEIVVSIYILKFDILTYVVTYLLCRVINQSLKILKLIMSTLLQKVMEARNNILTYPYF